MRHRASQLRFCLVRRWVSKAVRESSKATNSQPSEQGDVQGMSSERLARIAPVMKAQVDNGVFPGAVTMVARRGQLLHFEAHGFLDAAKSKPMPKDDTNDPGNQA
jgi:CubicO group peptidase (beta-lactamase class C family)